MGRKAGLRCSQCASRHAGSPARGKSAAQCAKAARRWAREVIIIGDW